MIPRSPVAKATVPRAYTPDARQQSDHGVPGPSAVHGEYIPRRFAPPPYSSHIGYPHARREMLLQISRSGGHVDNRPAGMRCL